MCSTASDNILLGSPVGRPGAEVLEYIFEVLVEIMVKYPCLVYSDFTSTSEYFFNIL